MNAKYFGVPQARQRIIFIGVRDDLGKVPIHPRPEEYPITFYHACGDLRGNVGEDRILPDVVQKIARLQPDTWSSDEKIYSHVKGSTGGAISTSWLSWHRVAGTLLKSEIGNTGMVHPDRERFISLLEAKRLSGFPDDYWFSGRDKGIERMGNCVPPPLMTAIARKIHTEYLKA
jgi:DNA (cytosine-5)-methyltransferase 1